MRIDHLGRGGKERGKERGEGRGEEGRGGEGRDVGNKMGDQQIYNSRTYR